MALKTKDDRKAGLVQHEGAEASTKRAGQNLLVADGKKDAFPAELLEVKRSNICKRL